MKKAIRQDIAIYKYEESYQARYRDIQVWRKLSGEI